MMSLNQRSVHREFVLLSAFALAATMQQAQAADGPPAAPVAPATAASTGSSKTQLTDLTQVKFGEGSSAKFNALIQGWSVANQVATSKDQNFRLRRAELKLSGSIAGTFKPVFMVDPAKLIPAPGGKAAAADQMIQDLALTAVVAPGLELTAGQFKIPAMAEALDSSGELPLPERSLVARTLGDKRELGVKVGYKVSAFNASVMLSSGKGITQGVDNWASDVIARVEATPMSGTSAGIFGLLGGGSFDYVRKGRVGLNARTTLGAFQLRGEGALAKDKGVDSSGWTLEAGYFLTPDLLPMVRVEGYSPNLAGSQLATAETVGVSYFFRDAYTKLQLAGSALQNLAATNGTPAYVAGALNQEITLVVQTSI